MGTSNTTYRFRATGMHCNSCALTIESDLMEVPGIASVVVDRAASVVDVTGAFGDEEASIVATRLTAVIAKAGYALSVEGAGAPVRRAVRWGEFALAAPVAALVIGGFIALQKAGLVDLISSDRVTYGTAFVVGVVASLSTCMAVVGGLVLSMSASFAKHGDKARPLVLFHASRLVAFFVLGGAIGALGSAFRIGGMAALALALVIGLVMLVMGLNLLDLFDWADALRPSLPPFLARRTVALAKLDHSLVPAAVGVGTFFLPCGFTQSMQIYTLGTGGFLAGGLTMFVFALGTLPVLALVSFGSLGMKDSPYKGVFFKAAGIVVIAFALFNMAAALVAAGLVRPFINL